MTLREKASADAEARYRHYHERLSDPEMKPLHPAYTEALSKLTEEFILVYEYAYRQALADAAATIQAREDYKQAVALAQWAEKHGVPALTEVDVICDCHHDHICMICVGRQKHRNSALAALPKETK
jgi:hypothetical protein